MKTHQNDDQNLFHERLAVAIGGFAHFELLHSACRFDLFGYLKSHPGTSSMQISRDLKIPQHSLRILLMECRYLGLLKEQNHRFFNSRRAESFVRDNPAGIWPVLDGFHSIVYPAMHRLPESLRKGKNLGLRQFEGPGQTLYERLANHPRLEKVFHHWMAGLNRAGGLTGPVIELLRPKLEPLNHLVDYGGGDASNAIQLCRHYPNLHITVFDSASVCKLAKRKIKAAGLAHRIFVREGDFLKDRFLKDVDGVMFNHIFNIYSKDTNAGILRKSRESLRKGGVAMVFNTVSFDAEDGPAGAPVLSSYFLALATGEGMVYPMKDYDEWFRVAGFRNLEKFRLPEIAHGLLIAQR